VRAASSVLELPAGTVARAGLTEGTIVEIEGPSEGAGYASGVWTAFCNLALALFYFFFASAHLSLARRTGQWPTVLPMVIQEALLVVLFLARRQSLATSGRIFDWIVGVAGTFLPLFMRATDELGPLSWLGKPVQAVGLVASVMAIGFLGRSFGLVAANRGIKTRGLYRVVRHPIYASYVLGYLGYVLSYPTTWNCVLTAITLAALGARASVEERFLERDAGYREYLRRTRWRFVPYLY
jgi:protein-S-isoprenylcysteine O-methyltransferase Ste14